MVAFRKSNNHDVVREYRGNRWMDGVMNDGETENIADFRSRYPLDLKRAAGRTYWSWRMTKPVTYGTALEAQLVLLAVIPEDLIID
jgi:hypothetical protein